MVRRITGIYRDGVVQLPSPLAIENNSEVIVSYRTKRDGGHLLQPGKYAAPQGLTMSTTDDQAPWEAELDEFFPPRS